MQVSGGKLMQWRVAECNDTLQWLMAKAILAACQEDG